MARDRLNQWASLPYYNPTKVLREAIRQGFRHELGGRSTLPSEISHAERKRLVEDLDVAVFAHGLRELLPGSNVCVAEFEALDHDFVLRFGPPDEPGYCPLQLKVSVSQHVNGTLTPESVLASLGKYTSSLDLVVAVKIDRSGLDPRAIAMPQLAIGELWFFGPCSERAATWYLFGDCLSVPQLFEFTLPSAK